MLRVHFMQQWRRLSEPAMEEASSTSRCTASLPSLMRMAACLMSAPFGGFAIGWSQHKLADQILSVVSDLFSAQELLLKAGAAVYATLIAAPSHTKNRLQLKTIFCG
jgi:IS5 family transposase